ncbi:hypothetical protein TNCV_1870331 [Trichonephila clavipes]|nr:hypothetical protein TNCV_1870331 [Trichonephila clavipes]
MTAQTITPNSAVHCRYRLQDETGGLLGTFRYVYDHQNTACRTGTSGKDDIVPLLYPVLSFGVPESPYLSMLDCQKKTNGRRADNPRCCKRCRTVRAETERTEIHARFLTNGP